MAFIPEDGTGLPEANAYIDVAFADSYFEDRGNASWVVKDLAVREAAIIQATDYINARWGNRFRGVRLKDDQSLPLPTDAYNGIPINLKKATAEYAIRATIGPLAPDLETDASGYQVSQYREKVGPLEETKTFATGATAKMSSWKVYPVPDALMGTLLRASVGRVYRD